MNKIIVVILMFLISGHNQVVGKTDHSVRLKLTEIIDYLELSSGNVIWFGKPASE